MEGVEKVESSMEFSLCRGCRRNLTVVYGRYKWYVARGYSQKDAAAQVLYKAGNNIESRECCALNLQTNFDSNKAYVEKSMLKETARLEELERIKGETGRLPQRPIVKIFSANEIKTVGGTFIIDNGGENIESVADMLPPYPPVEHRIDPNTGEEVQYQPATKLEGFHITNIAKIPQGLMDAKHWRGPQFLILWSGTIKIIPVINKGGDLVPGNMWLHFINPETGLEDTRLIDRFDKSLLEAELIDYQNVNLNFQGTGVINTDSITLKKQFPQDIIGWFETNRLE